MPSSPPGNGIKILALVVFVPLVLLSVPWVAWALVCGFAGDYQGYENTLNNCPCAWWMDWVDSRA